jgi:putative spermidine/putrescine transport system permease protein
VASRPGRNPDAVPRWLTVYTWALVVLIAIPIVIVVPVSLNRGASLSLPTHGISLRWYANVLAHPAFLDGFRVSLEVSVAATVLALFAGTMTAYALTRYPLPLLDTLFLAPLAFPAVVFGVAMLIFLAPLGLVRSVPGLILAHLVVTLPYVVRTMTTSMKGIDEHVEEAAMILGASRARVLRYIVVPLVAPGLLSAAVFSFIVSFDEFSVSMFLVGPRVMTLPLEIFNYIQFLIDPTVAAVSVGLLVLTVGMTVIVERTVGLQRHFYGAA